MTRQHLHNAFGPISFSYITATTTASSSPFPPYRSIMEDESHHPKKKTNLPVLLFNVALFAIGTGGPFLTRIYFVHGGTRRWLTSFIQNIGWPIFLIPLSISYARRRHRHPGSAEPVLMTAKVAAACVAIGMLSGSTSYFYAYGSSCLPVTTSSLILSTQLAFTAFFAFLIVKQRFTPFSINSIVLLVIGAAILGFQSSDDRPLGESRARYLAGFFMTVGSAAVNGLIAPLVELVYMKVKQKVTYALVMEIQMVVSIWGAVFCLVGMLVSKDFQAIPREAKAYGLGEVKYYLVLGFATLLWQMLSLGFIGIISCSSSLLAAIVMAVLIPVGQVLPVILLHESFSWEKAISIALSLWGFTSYLYGERKQQRQKKKEQELQEGAAKHSAIDLEMPSTQ